MSLPESPVLETIAILRPQYLEHFAEFAERNPWFSDRLTRLAEYSFWTYEHSLRTAYLAGRLAENWIERAKAKAMEAGEETFPWDDRYILLLARAGVLHDIGKLSVPVDILDSPYPLNDSQRKIISRHPEEAFEFLMYDDSEVAQIVVAHHEFQREPYPGSESRKYDREYFPAQGLLALSDQIDALMSERPYKIAWTNSQQIIDELNKHFPIEEIFEAIALRNHFGIFNANL